MRVSSKAAGLAVLFVVTAICLRASFTCIGLLGRCDTVGSGEFSGVMRTVTTILVLMFAAFSMVIGDLGRRRRAGDSVVPGLLTILAGVICCSILGTLGLFLGTAVMGIGIIDGNVLIPAFIQSPLSEQDGQTHQRLHRHAVSDVGGGGNCQRPHRGQDRMVRVASSVERPHRDHPHPLDPHRGESADDDEPAPGAGGRCSCRGSRSASSSTSSSNP